MSTNVNMPRVVAFLVFSVFLLPNLLPGQFSGMSFIKYLLGGKRTQTHTSYEKLKLEWPVVMHQGQPWKRLVATETPRIWVVDVQLLGVESLSVFYSFVIYSDIKENKNSILKFCVFE